MTSSKQDTRLYELRTYSLVPQRAGEFMKLSNEKMHLRTSHSVLLGYWTTELGGLNEVVHLWEYGSLSERAGVRAKLGADPVWQADYFQKILPMMTKQDNITCTSLLPVDATNSNVATTSTGGGYELWQLQMSSLPDTWVPLLLEAVQSLHNEERSVIGVYKCDVGDMNSAVVIWRHANIDKINSCKTEFMQSEKGKVFWNEVAHGKSKFLQPTQFSNWK